jgi:hypothetical protein
MHSGGGTKEEPYEKIYIEAPEDEAKVIFYNRFGHSPERVSCTCCGEDYSISESSSLEEITGYHRGCAFDKKENQYIDQPSTEPFRKPYKTLKEYKKEDYVLVISNEEIKEDEREGELPEEGYVWI